MPKLKTHKGAASRLHVTGTGKIMRTKIGKTHFRRRKSKRTKELLAKKIELSPRDRSRMKKLIPYGT